MTADQRRTALSRASVVRSRTFVRSLSFLVLASRISRCSLSNLTADQRRTALSRASVVRSRTCVRSLTTIGFVPRISRCSLSKGFAADDLRLTLSPLSFSRSRTCCTLTRFPTSVSRDPRSSLRVFDGRSTSNCFVACLGRSLTYLLYARSLPSCSLRNSLLFVKVQGAFGACRSCRRSRRQGVIYHLPKLKSTSF